MISEQIALAAIYPPLIFLLALVLYRLTSTYGFLVNKGWHRSKYMALGACVIVTGLLLEQVWYGAGRFVPSLYNSMTSVSYIVGLLKLFYVAGILIWTKAYVVITEQENTNVWRCTVAFSVLTFLLAFYSAYVAIQG